MNEILQFKESSKAIKTPNDVFKNIKKINVDYSQENFLAIYLNTKNEPINSEIVFKGGLNSCLIDPKTLFRKALLNNANNIIIAHNHPSDDLEPSNEDKEIYEKLKNIGLELQLKVLDSIIFNKEEFYSLNE